MAIGIKALRKIQVVKETGHAVNNTATARLIGTLDMKQDQKYFRPDDYETGKLSSYEYSTPISEIAKLPLNAPASFEQLGYVLGMTVVGGITGANVADNAYTWAYTPHLTSAANVDSYTIQYGDDVQAFQSSFCFGQNLEISGTMDDFVKVKSDLVGQNSRTTTFTSNVANPTVITPIPTSVGKFYVNSEWANVGNTQVSGTLIDFSYKTSTGINPVKYIDGNIYFSDMAEKKRNIELNLTYAFTSGVAGYFANYIASPQTKQFIRIKFVGPKIGATTGYDELWLDGCFVIDDYAALTEREGQDVVKLKLLSIYDSTSSSEWAITLKNALSALP